MSLLKHNNHSKIKRGWGERERKRGGRGMDRDRECVVVFSPLVRRGVIAHCRTSKSGKVREPLCYNPICTVEHRRRPAICSCPANVATFCHPLRRSTSKEDNANSLPFLLFQVKVSRSQITSDDVFILDDGTKFYQFNGSSANMQEKYQVSTR